MKTTKLTAQQVLARMRRGDLPQMVGAGGFTAVFDDGQKAGHQTMRRLEKAGHIDRPVGTSISSRWTLAATTAREVRFGSWATWNGAWLPVLVNLPDTKVTPTNYSVVVSDSEWELVVTFTGRQDGRVDWMVLLVQVDDEVKYRQGLDKYDTVHDAVNRAIFSLTRDKRWIDPLNRFTETQA